MTITSLFLQCSKFIANRANSNGGTIFSQASFVDIYNCTFNISTAVSGGIMHATYGALNINNSTFSYNNVKESGGIVKASAMKSLKILWCNFTSSRATESGGVLHLTEYSNATIGH